MPHPLKTRGVGWLVAVVVLLVLSVVVFAGELRGPAVTVTAVDVAIVRWLAGLDVPGLRSTMRVIAALGSWKAITVLLWGLLVALVILRRFRHLLVVVIAWTMQGVPGRAGPATTWYTVFQGGCVTAELYSTGEEDGALTTQASTAVGFTSRHALQQALDERSNGRLHLDAAAPG